MQTHVVFGAGQVGASLARSLHAAGHRVRVVRRGSAPVAPGVEVVSGDARDPAFATRVSAGASSLYHCMNPSTYSGRAWEAEFPAQGEALIAAALAHDARLVCLDNLYGYGVVDGARTESTPMRAEGRKGRVRIAWRERLQAEPRLRFAVGHAADFFGPGTAGNSLFSPDNLGRLARGGSMWLIGDPRAPHAFSYVPDVVAGLVALGGAGGVDRQAFHLPVLTLPPGELVARLAQALGGGRARALPAWLLRLLAPVVPLFAELKETLYQWDRPFLVDDSAWRARFPAVGSALELAVAQTAASLSAGAARQPATAG